MAQAPIGLASTSISTSSHDITVKLKLPPPRNGKTYDKEMQNGSLSEGNGSHSEKTRGETSQTQSIGVDDHIEITNENSANEEGVENHYNREIERNQSELVLREDVLIRTAVRVESESNMKIEIVKSVVYGGLTELITSLGMVTSSSTTKTTTGKTVAVSVASLVVGMFVMAYKVSELWMKKGAETRDEEGISYENVLGDRKNYRLHFTVAILSFVVFGLIPPLVYGFTFNKPADDKKLKISAVTVVSVLGIALLANGKAYIQRPSTCAEYVIIVGKCIGDTIGTSALTTFGGNLLEQYIEQSGIFSGDNLAPVPAKSFKYAY